MFSTLERRIESLRKKMENTASIFGLRHPKVYKLSKELDFLHNKLERERLDIKGNFASKKTFLYNFSKVV